MSDTTKLKTIIEQKGVKQTRLASQLGISDQSLSMKLNGKRPFKLEEAKTICRLLNISKFDGYNIFLF